MEQLVFKTRGRKTPTRDATYESNVVNRVMRMMSIAGNEGRVEKLSR